MQRDNANLVVLVSNEQKRLHELVGGRLILMRFLRLAHEKRT